MACSSLLSDDDLRRFRTKPCRRNKQRGASCEFGPDRCQYSHSEAWPRRCPFYLSNPSSIRYIPYICPDVLLGDSSEQACRTIGTVESNRCTRGGACPFAHSLEEILYHPLHYKTKICERFIKGECSTYYCPFVHGTAEKRDTSSAQYTLPFARNVLTASPFPNVEITAKIPVKQKNKESDLGIDNDHCLSLSNPNSTTTTTEDLSFQQRASSQLSYQKSSTISRHHHQNLSSSYHHTNFLKQPCLLGYPAAEGIWSDQKSRPNSIGSTQQSSPKFFQEKNYCKEELFVSSDSIKESNNNYSMSPPSFPLTKNSRKTVCDLKESSPLFLYERESGGITPHKNSQKVTDTSSFTTTASKYFPSFQRDLLAQSSSLQSPQWRSPLTNFINLGQTKDDHHIQQAKNQSSNHLGDTQSTTDSYDFQRLNNRSTTTLNNKYYNNNSLPTLHRYDLALKKRIPFNNRCVEQPSTISLGGQERSGKKQYHVVPQQMENVVNNEKEVLLSPSLSLTSSSKSPLSSSDCLSSSEGSKNQPRRLEIDSPLPMYGQLTVATKEASPLNIAKIMKLDQKQTVPDEILYQLEVLCQSLNNLHLGNGIASCNSNNIWVAIREGLESLNSMFTQPSFTFL